MSSEERIVLSENCPKCDTATRYYADAGGTDLICPVCRNQWVHGRKPIVEGSTNRS